MSKIFSSIFTTLRKLTRSKIVIGIIVVLVLGGGYLIFIRPGSTKYQFITVTRGSIAETVSVTGNTTPIQGVSLGFQNSGTIAHVYYNLGNKVNAGNVIADLNIADLSAVREQAQAKLDTGKANLASLQQGTRPEQIALDQSAVSSAQTALGDTIQNGYVGVEDGIQNKIVPFFGTISTVQEPLILDSKYYNLLPLLLQTLSAWNSELNTITPSNSSKAAQDADGYLSVLISSVDNVNSDIRQQASETSFPLSIVQSLLAQITAVRLTLTNTKTAIDNAESILATGEATLTLAQAGSTVNDIAAAQAQVEEAQAGVASAEADLKNSEIIAPISGVITEQDAKIGQLASLGAPLISIVGNNGFEVDMGVAETDIGKIVIGDGATMALDAFPNETFTGSVFYVASAETNTQGVITYLVKISFDKPDARLKSGLTANVDIQTKHKDNVLILPQYAILQNDQGTFVETLENKKIEQNPVILGIADQKGNVEVISGATEGEQVLNIGLKAQ